MAETPATAITTSHQTTRSKREKYSSIACEECRSRKLKCRTTSIPGAGCERCTSQGLTCKITRPARGLRGDLRQSQPSVPTSASQNDEPHVRFQKMEDELNLLRHQVAQLTSSYPQQSSNAPGQECRSGQQQSEEATPFTASQIQTRVEPHFVGTTRPTFTLNIAKASLELMGVAVPNDDSEPEQPQLVRRNTSLFAANDPLLRLPVDEIQRLFAVFQDEIASSYPAFYCWDTAAKIPHLVGHLSAPAPDRHRAADNQKQTQFLKMAVATALVLEETGRSKLGLDLFTSVEQETGTIFGHAQVDLMEIRIMAVMATYHFYCDEELFAWRTLGIAARLVLEMGLHRRQTLISLPNQREREEALAVFWCVYELDRRWSLGTGLSFAIVDRDVDPELPEPPPAMAYLQCLADYARLCSKVWDALPQFGSTCISTSPALLLDHQIQDWCASIPTQFRLSSHFYPGMSPSSSELDHRALAPSRATRNVRTMLYIRGNHLRSLVNRHHVISSSAISANTQQARLVVDIARDSIQVIVTLSKETDIYARQQPGYNHYLVSALAIVLLATCHAPQLFAATCRQDFSDAVNLVRGFSETSIAGHRLWKSMSGLVSAVSALGLGTEINQTYHIGDEYQIPPFQQIENQFDAGMRDLFDPSFYKTAAQPDMGHVSTDLMGLYDAVWHGNTVGTAPDLLHDHGSMDEAIASLVSSGSIGPENDAISRYFLGLI
ncbi:putative fungal-specific transcription factor domain protein [Triangularia verruculosa]|uniref:Fungal-specific transcription factor domain protein n=1 Tax=Triangularia verruculosa TaxID=2587418 RepID=A0AAN7APX7_9PEZI|nr:putative fungal-specific transcription factor domain protein [Triangularia verruculosa]